MSERAGQTGKYVAKPGAIGQPRATIRAAAPRILRHWQTLGRASPRPLAGRAGQQRHALAWSGAVGDAKLLFGRIVGGVDEGCGAAVGGGGLAVRVLGEDSFDGHGRAPLLFVVGLGLGLDLANDAAVVGLALVFGHVEKTGQGREPEVEGGGKLHGQGVLVALAGKEFFAAVEPGAAEDCAGGEGGDAVGAWPGDPRPRVDPRIPEALRDYQRDDDYRAIDWKATARRQKLITREYQQERNQSVLCMLDCGRLKIAETQGLSQLDHALNAVLMLSHVATRAGDQVGLLAFDARVRAFLPPQSGRRAAQRVVAASYDIHAEIVETDFEAAYGYLSQRLRKRSLVVLFTEVIDEVSAKSVVRTVRSLGPRHLALVVLFRDETLDAMAEPRRTQGDIKAADLYQRAAGAEAILWRDRLVRDLQEAGALVLHVSPRKLTPTLINRHLHIKAQRLL